MQDSDLEKAIALSLGGSGISRDETLTPAKRSEAGGTISEDARRSMGRGAEAGRREKEDDVARRDREIRAAAAERRLQARTNEQEAVHGRSQSENAGMPAHVGAHANPPLEKVEQAERLSPTTASVLWDIVFGRTPPAPSVISQWTSQGFRFSTDAHTGFGLVQRQGGPCGVLAPIQAFVLKYLLFHSPASPASEAVPFRTQTADCQRLPTVSEAQQSAALVEAIAEVLWRCGGGCRATVATLSGDILDRSTRDEAVNGTGELHHAADLPRLIRVHEASSLPHLRRILRTILAALSGGMGALLVLFSALLSRGLDVAESDRDDPSTPLVTPPFGHASQEIVNLLLSGAAVAHVFDGNMDMGSGLQLKGIAGDIQVGFLTQLEFLHYCTVGDLLKHPKYPIWVVGSESHYSVLFALSNAVQEDSKEVARMKEVRNAFHACDMSGGGGGFVPAAELDGILAKVAVRLRDDELAALRQDEVVLWQDFWEVIRRHDSAQAAGSSSSHQQQQMLVAGSQPVVPTGWGAPTHTWVPAAHTEQAPPPPQALAVTPVPPPVRGQQFRLYHFNGIAKSWDTSNGGVASPLATSALPVGLCEAQGMQAAEGAEDGRSSLRPHLVELSVSVPPKWNGDLSALDLPPPPLLPLFDSVIGNGNSHQGSARVAGANEQGRAPTPMHAPLVDCIRTRWQGAVCAWVGTAPSIV